MFDPATGEINVTDTQQACEAAARPAVDEAYRNHCGECLPEYLGDDAAMTHVIPLEPQRTWRTNPTRGGAGVALNGVRLDGPAPVDAIHGAHTIAPFDDCGGQVNPHVGYHYHAVTDCLNDAPEDGHAGRIGIAMDGYPIFGHLLVDGTPPQDLDRCNGHEAEGMGYHYHAGEAGSNAILGCLRAESGCALEESDRPCDASARRPPG